MSHDVSRVSEGEVAADRPPDVVRVGEVGRVTPVGFARIGWLACLAGVLPLLLTAPIITYDGPQHVFAGYLINHLNEGWEPFLELKVGYSALFVPVVFAALESVLPWALAERMLWVTLALLASTGLWRVVCATRGTGPETFATGAWWTLPLVVAFPYMSIFYFGFHNYVAGVALGAHALASWIGFARSGGAGRAFGVAALSLATVLSHAFAALALGLLWATAVLVETPQGARKTRWPGAFAAVAPVLAMIALVAYTARDGAPVVVPQTGGHAWWLPWVRNFFEAPLGVGWWGVAAMWLVLAAALGLRTRRAGVGGGHATRGAALAIGVAYLLVAGLAPESHPLWQTLGCRFAGPALVAFVWASSCTELGPWETRGVARAAGVIVSALVLFSLIGVTREHRALAEVRSDVLSGLGAAAPEGLRRIYYRPGAPSETVRPRHMAANAHVYYMIEEGGLFELLFRDRREQHIVFTRPAFDAQIARATVGFRSSSVDEMIASLAHDALRRDDVLLWQGAPRLVEALVQRGFEVTYAERGVTRLRPPGRRLALRVVGVESAPAAAVMFDTTGMAFGETTLEACGASMWCGELVDMPASEVRLFVFDAASRALVGEQSVDLRGGDQRIQLGEALP